MNSFDPGCALFRNDPSPRSGTVAAPAGNGRNQKGLLVEDDPLSAEILTTLLGSHHGWTLDVARDGIEALALFGRQLYSVVLLDWTLPERGPSGIQVCREMRRTSTRVGLLFMSGRGATADKLHAFAAGADDYLAKPFDVAELAARAAALARRASPSAPAWPPPPEQAPLRRCSAMRPRDPREDVLRAASEELELTTMGGTGHP